MLLKVFYDDVFHDRLKDFAQIATGAAATTGSVKNQATRLLHSFTSKPSTLSVSNTIVCGLLIGVRLPQCAVVKLDAHSVEPWPVLGRSTKDVWTGELL